MQPVSDPPDPHRQRLSRRLKGFGLHLLAYIIVMIVLVPVNLLLFPQTVWFVLPMVGWGSVLAVHVAFAMGLFGSGGGPS